MEDILCNKIKVLRFVNSPVPSNAYLLIDGTGANCIVVDPGSKEQSDIRDYIRSHGLNLDFIILTHEHFDHCWGANYLRNEFPRVKVVSSKKCADWVKVPRNYFNQLYYNSDETYSIDNIDLILEDSTSIINWDNIIIKFIITPGHTDKGICIDIEGALFTGDTLLNKTKPFLKNKYGASKEDLRKSIKYIFITYPPTTKIYPGHGEPFLLHETESFYKEYFLLDV